MRTILCVLALAAVLIPCAVRVESAPVQLGLHVKPCVEGKAKVPALCGTYGVYENRASRSGKIIPIAIVVLEAKEPSHHAIAMIAGGPGEAAVPYAPFIADDRFEKALAQLRDRYNLIFMDDRGMGDSNGLPCSLAPQNDPAVYFRDLFPAGVVKACRARLSAANDLAEYDTNNAVDDLNDIRAALGYPKLVLDGGSYGTFFSLVYMRRHPQSVEAAVLNGVAPPGFQPLPGEPMGAQRALDDLIAKCKRDAKCNAHFPTFAQQFHALIARLDKGTIPVRLVAKKGEKPVTVQLSKVVFVDHLRQTLYDPYDAAYVPYAVDQEAHGNTTPLATIINLTAVGLDEDLTTGAWFSYTCAEMIPFLDQAAVDSAAAHSFAGDLRIEAQRNACKIWNVPAMPASFNDPVSSDAPTLILSGSDDPATPPRYAAAAAKYLPNARIVLVQGAGHAEETPCTDALVVQFVRADSAKALDVNKCSAAFTVPPFATSMKALDD